MSDRLNILVTGASGLVGAETTSRLVRAGHHVYGLVHNVGEIVANNGRRVSSAPWTAASARESGVVRLLRGDVTRHASASTARRGPASLPAWTE